LTQRHGELIERDPGGDGHHQRIFIQAGGDVAHHFQHDIGLHRAEHDIRRLSDFLGALRAVDAVFALQGGDIIG